MELVPRLGVRTPRCIAVVTPQRLSFGLGSGLGSRSTQGSFAVLRERGHGRLTDNPSKALHLKKIRSHLAERWPYLKKLSSYVFLGLGILLGERSVRLVELPLGRKKSREFFVNPVLRTKSAIDSVPISFEVEAKSVAIIVQGPIARLDDYTLTTVSRYREWYPSVPIFVSTWNNQDPKILDEIENVGCELVLLDSASFRPGPSNQNLQMATTRAALLAAKANGSQYVIKTRSDQRINNKFAIPSLPLFLEIYPLSRTGEQRQRLVVPSLGTLLFRPYSVTDMLMFGGVDDMLLYWDGAFDHRTALPKSRSLRDWSKLRAAEVAFCANFLERNGLTLDFSLEQHWKVLAERFVVLDQAFLDLHWPKYSSVENSWGTWKDRPKYREVSFSLWTLMHAGLLSADDGLLDEKK